MMPIKSKGSHQYQGPSAFPAPLTPQCSRHLLPSLPAPPARSAACEFIGVYESNESSNIYMPMLTPTLITPSTWEEYPGLKPRLSTYMLDANSECSTSLLSTPPATFSSYPYFPSEVTSGPSPAALDDESFSLSDDSTDELFLDFPMASEVHLEPRLSARKDPSCWWFCPIPINGDSPGVRLQPRRSLPLSSNDEVRDNSFLHLMPMEL
jgi:hypothetical protein